MADRRHELTLIIINSVKELNGYTEEARSCGTCCHFTERADSHVDRMWTPVCTLISASAGIDIEVKSSAYCHRWTGGRRRSE